jgi:hypothetical protein
MNVFGLFWDSGTVHRDDQGGEDIDRVPMSHSHMGLLAEEYADQSTFFDRMMSPPPHLCSQMGRGHRLFKS